MKYYAFRLVGEVGDDPGFRWADMVDRGRLVVSPEYRRDESGDYFIESLAKWDWVLVHVRGKGFVGAGKVRGTETFKLNSCPGTEHSTPRSCERGVVWKYVIRDVCAAIPYEQIGAVVDLGGWQQIMDRPSAKAVIRQLYQQGEDLRSHEVQYWWVVDALKALGRPGTRGEIEAWIESKHPKDDHSDVRDNICALTVNDANRRHHDKARLNWRSDQGHPKDLIVRHGFRVGVSYELYDARLHGVWDLQLNGNGKIEAVQAGVAVSSA